MGVRRSHLSFDEKYTQVPNEWVRDARLSRRARGLLVEIMSHRIGWHVTIRSLARAGKEGRDAIQTALNELLECGYIQRMQGRGEAGKFSEIEYELCEPPASGFSVHGSAVSGSTVSGESDHKEEHPSEDHVSEDDLVSLSREIEPVEPDVFEQIWTLWHPKRRGASKVGRTKLAAALKAVGAETVLSGVRRDVAVWRTWPAQDAQFIPLLSTWLSQGRWEESAAAQPRGNARSFAQQKQDTNLALVARYQEEENHAQVGSRDAADVRAIAAGS